MAVKIKTATFKPSDSIFIRSCLGNPNIECDSNSIHAGTKIWLLPQFIPKPAKTSLSRRVTAVTL